MASLFGFAQTCPFSGIFYHSFKFFRPKCSVWILPSRGDGLRHKLFLWDSLIGRNQGLSDLGYLLASLCHNLEKLFFLQKFAWEYGLWSLSCRQILIYGNGLMLIRIHFRDIEDIQVFQDHFCLDVLESYSIVSITQLLCLWLDTVCYFVEGQ